MAFRRFASAVLWRQSSTSLSLHISALYEAACYTFAWLVGGEGQSRYRPRPLVDLVKQVSSFVFHVSGPSLPRVQLRALPARHYQASAPYCITDGADRRERRQPACFLEGWGVCSWVRRGRRGEYGRKDGAKNAVCLHVNDGKKKIYGVVLNKKEKSTINQAVVTTTYLMWSYCSTGKSLKDLTWHLRTFPVVLLDHKWSAFPLALFPIIKAPFYSSI